MRTKRKLVRLGLVCLFWAAFDPSQAQQLDLHDSVLNLSTDRYFTLGLGSMSIELDDEHMSPLNYYGGAFYLQLGAFKRKNNSLRNLTIGAATTNIRPRPDDREIEPSGKYYRLDVSYAQHQYIRSFWKNSTRWYVGGKFRSHSNVRLNPQLDGAFVTFIFANGLFASSVLEREIKISGRPLTANWQLDLPIINHTIRPNYLNIYDFVDPESNWVQERIDDSQWRGIGSYTNITSTISLLYPISTSNVLRFGYEWDFYHINSELQSTNATHTFIFSLLFHF